MTTVKSEKLKVKSEKPKIASCLMPFVLLFTFYILHFTLVSLAFGSEGAAHGGIFDEYKWKVVNFAILVFVLVWFAKKPLKEFLKKRTEVIEKTLKEAQEAKELAQKALSAVEERLKLKDKEIEEILSRSRSAAEREKELLVKQGEQMKEKILEQAKNNIDYELRLAKDAIKAEAADIAIELAEKKLKERLTKEEQIRLIEESLKRMETRN
ncbi:MAG TPA: ATP synthase F0 subunit B [Thermodesulfovibrionales bacterium]|nr:ATP synthase F0 subunit B [Thermodesulfovibrionales bacterium]